MIPARGIILQGGAKPVPSFSRDFAGTKSLNDGIGPAIAFSRASNATYFDSSGVLQYAENNALLNSEGVGFVSGTPGTAPAQWNVATSGFVTGITRTITAPTTGDPYIKIRYTGTAASGTTSSLFLDPVLTTSIPAILGQLWTFSTYVSVTVNSGTTPNCYIRIAERGTSGNQLAFSLTNFSSSTSTLTSVSRTLNQSAVYYVTGEIRAEVVNGSTYDFTVSIYQPQLELGVGSRTTYKPTTTGMYGGPRFDTDPATLQSKGLLIEEQRVNLFTYSNAFDNAAWTGAFVNRTAASGTSPDGTNNAYKFAENTTTSQSFQCSQTVNVTSGYTYTLSVFAKAAERGFVQLVAGSVSAVFNLSTGAITSVVGTPNSTQATALSNGWWRLSISNTAIGTGAQSATRIAIARDATTTTYAGTVGSGILVYGAQYEINTTSNTGTFVTSYIPTGASTATRNADVANITGADFTSFYNQAAGTLSCNFIPEGSLTLQTLWGLSTSGSSATNAFYLFQESTSLNAFINGSRVSGPTFKTSLTKSVVSQTRSVSSVLCVDGVLFQSSNSQTTDVVNIGIGSLGTGARYFNGWISSIAYYPKRLTDNQLISLTT